jgi:hypothetical protein
MLISNPRRALDSTVDRANQEGWHCHQILPHSSRNLLIVLLQIVVLLLTFGLWTWGAGYLLLMQKQRAS